MPYLYTILSMSYSICLTQYAFLSMLYQPYLYTILIMPYQYAILSTIIISEFGQASFPYSV